MPKTWPSSIDSNTIDKNPHVLIEDVDRLK